MNIYSIPEALQSLLNYVLCDALKKYPFKQICSEIKNISENYSGVRGEATFCKFDNEISLISYILYFQAINFVKSLSVLEDSKIFVEDLFGRKNISILDIGSGTGASYCAFLFKTTSLNQEFNKLNLLCTDRSKNALKWGMYILNKLAADLSSRNIKNLNIESLWVDVKGDFQEKLQKLGNFDVCVMCDSLVEIISCDTKIERCFEFIKTIIEKNINSDGYLIIIEPALQNVSKRLNLVVDELKKIDGIEILAPCLKRNPCPKAKDEDFWCYKEIRFKRPDYFIKIDKQIGHRKDFVRYAYLIIRKGRVEMKERGESKGEVFRVVGDIRKEKGYVQCALCDGEKHIIARLLKRNTTETNKNFWNIMRGDLIAIDFVKKFNLDENFIEIVKEDKLYHL